MWALFQLDKEYDNLIPVELFLHICQILKAVSPFILRAERAKKNNGNENNILPPIAKIIAINKDKIIIKVLTPLAIFFVFCRANQDNNKNVMTKIIIPVITIFI